MNFNVIDYWNAIKAKSGDSRNWNDLHPSHQHMIVQSINQLLLVLSTDPKLNPEQATEADSVV